MSTSRPRHWCQKVPTLPSQCCLLNADMSNTAILTLLCPALLSQHCHLDTAFPTLSSNSSILMMLLPCCCIDITVPMLQPQQCCPNDAVSHCHQNATLFCCHSDVSIRMPPSQHFPTLQPSCWRNRQTLFTLAIKLMQIWCFNYSPMCHSYYYFGTNYWTDIIEFLSMQYLLKNTIQYASPIKLSGVEFESCFTPHTCIWYLNRFHVIVINSVVLQHIKPYIKMTSFY